MSNSTALAAVTTTLQFILHTGITTDPDLPELGDTLVTTLPPDKARGSLTANQLNLFLYQILPNAAWRNRDMPRQVQPGETAIPPLPLNLYYLITAFGRQDDSAQPFSHQVLGKAMSLLHDHCLLSAADIQSATSGSLPQTDLDKQIERVRITLQPLSVEDISKLWTGFATQYRLSAGYEVAVALIESTRGPRTPLPVLTRGKKDSGISSLPSLISPFPGLDDLVIPNKQTSARLGDLLLLNGHHLDGSNVGVQFNHPLWTNPVEVPPEANPTDLEVGVKIPVVPASWPAGFYTVAVLVQGPNDTYRRITNQLSFPLAPSISFAPVSAPAGNITFTVTVSPEVRPEQRADLLLGDTEILADAHKTQTNTLAFQAANVAAGDYYVRLRVDGVDSILIDRTKQPPVFDSTQKVTVT
jgi:Pvc16 N-terminal domain